MSEDELLTAEQAMAVLHIRAQTLYSYVSRGWLRSVGRPGRRGRLYVGSDVRKLKVRADARAGHGPTAASAMCFGEPIIATRVVAITPEGPSYRGHSALDLAKAGVSFEAVAELLWSGRRPEGEILWEPEPIPLPTWRLMSEARELGFKDLLEIFAHVALSLSHHCKAGAQNEKHTAIAARQLIQVLVACFGLISPSSTPTPMVRGQTIAAGLAASLGIASSVANLSALNVLLVLFADHELSPGTLSGRVAASSGSSLHPCVVAGLCTQMGTLIGQRYDALEASLDQAVSPGLLDEEARHILAVGQMPPGFHQPLYPDGDPRSIFIFDLLRRHEATKEIATVLSHVKQMWLEAKIRPRHELAVVLLLRALGAPAGTPGALFVLSRLAGLVAHVMEQWQEGPLLRPRAKYIE